MEPLKRLQKPRLDECPTTITRRAMLTGMALAALSPVACLGKHFARRGEVKPDQLGRLTSAWQNKVTYAPDVTRGGAVFPGLIARVYLFGPDVAVPYIGDGTLRLLIHDATRRGAPSDPKLTDIVDFNVDALKQFAKTDFVGAGYTIFCPWFNYRSDVTHVFINLEYTPLSGPKLFHQSGTLVVDHGETIERAKKGMPAYNADA